MKIGILTYHAVYNFGANLQTLSTYSYLKNGGHEPVIIDFYPEKLEEAFDRTVSSVQANAHKNFIEKHFHLTNRCFNSKEIAQEIARNNIEAIIIGSDAVVQHNSFLSRIRIVPSHKHLLLIRIDPIRYETNFPNPFWGEFISYLDTKPNVAMMSVSCQNTDYRFILGKEKRQMGKMIEKIRYITVRDRRTQDFFKYISNSKCIPEITPDPVFAFNDNVLNLPEKNEVLKKYQLSSKYILLSFNSSRTVNKYWLSSFEAIAEENGYQCVAFAMPGGINFDNNLRYKIDLPMDPLDWYSLIKYSSAYIGEKMHPIIVSLHNSVPFFSFDHYGIVRFKLFLNQKASKIYQILFNVDMNEYRVSIARHALYRSPSPDFVFNKIRSFNHDKCMTFADHMRNEYRKTMNRIVRILQSG